MSKKKKNLILNIIMLICAGVFLFSVFKLGTLYLTSKEAEDSFKEIKVELKSNRADFFKRHKDLVAWIKIRGTKVNYPVAWTPKDPEYYLRRNAKKKYSVAGLPFFGEGCSLKSKVAIIYGHNIRWGTMFNTLVDYSDKSFYRNHKYITMETKDYIATYKIFAAFKTKIDTSDDNKTFPYYEYVGNLSERRFNEFLSAVKRQQTYDTGVSANVKDKIIILSTCAYHTDNGRFVVVAKEVKRKYFD